MDLERKTWVQARWLTQTAGLILGLSQNLSQQLCWVFYCRRKGGYAKYYNKFRLPISTFLYCSDPLT